MQADVYEKIDKELLVYVEDVLLNRRLDSTERLLEYAATLDPKSAPTKLRKLVPDAPGPKIQPKLNPIPAGFDPIAPPEVMPPVPAYKQWVDPLVKSPAFEQLERLFQERIAFIDGGMGTMIQRYKLEVRASLPDGRAGVSALQVVTVPTGCRVPWSLLLVTVVWLSRNAGMHQ